MRSSNEAARSVMRSTEEIAMLLGGFEDSSEGKKAPSQGRTSHDRSPVVVDAHTEPAVDTWEPNSQSNSKLIQDKVLNDPLYLNSIFENIRCHAKEVIFDAFGNYLFSMVHL